MAEQTEYQKSEYEDSPNCKSSVGRSKLSETLQERLAAPIHREGNNVDWCRKSARPLTSELYLAALPGPYQLHSSVLSAAAPRMCNHRLGCTPCRRTAHPHTLAAAGNEPHATRPGQHAALATIIQLSTWLYDYLKTKIKYYIYVVLWLSLLQSHSIPQTVTLVILRLAILTKVLTWFFSVFRGNCCWSTCTVSDPECTGVRTRTIYITTQHLDIWI